MLRILAPEARAAFAAARVSAVLRLGDADDEVGAAEDRVAVADLGGDFDLRGELGERFDPVASGHGGVGAGTAGEEVDALDSGDEFIGEADFGAVDEASGGVNAAAQGVFDGAGLLVDLLEHEVLKTALFGLAGGPGDALDFAFGGLAVAVPDFGRGTGRCGRCRRPRGQ